MANEKISTLAAIQAKVKAPKKNHNNFGKFNYRSVENIYEAVKPVLEETGATLSITDEMKNVEGRFYLVATATLKVGNETYTSQGWARESESKSGMDPAQLTGACSSYARKYALCALFLIDGSDDFDAMDNREEGKAVKAATFNGDEGKPVKAATSNGDPDSDTRNFLIAMKALAQKNHAAYSEAMGQMGYESAADIPVAKRREVYKAINDAVMGATR